MKYSRWSIKDLIKLINNYFTILHIKCVECRTMHIANELACNKSALRTCLKKIQTELSMTNNDIGDIIWLSCSKFYLK